MLKGGGGGGGEGRRRIFIFVSSVLITINRLYNGQQPWKQMSYFTSLSSNTSASDASLKNGS